MTLPSSRDKRLLERFELNSDRTRLVYAFDLIDPQYFEEPVAGQTEWAYYPNYEFPAEGCDLENAQLYLEGLEPLESDN